MGFFEDNAGLFFVAIALLSGVSGFVGAHIRLGLLKKTLQGWFESR